MLPQCTAAGSCFKTEMHPTPPITPPHPTTHHTTTCAHLLLEGLPVSHTVGVQHRIKVDVHQVVKVLGVVGDWACDG